MLFEACENDSDVQKCHREAMLNAFLHCICEGTEQIHYRKENPVTQKSGGMDGDM